MWYNWYTENCIYSTCTIWWVQTYANTHDTTTTIMEVGISNTAQSFLVSLLCLCFMVRTFNIRSTLFIHFELHNAILLSVGAMLHWRSLEFIHLEHLKLYTHWKTTPHFPHPSDTDNHYCSLSVRQVNG